MASTGVPALDQALGGLFWGDNVVWESRQEASVEPFFRSVASLAAGYQEALYVALTRAPEDVAVAYPELAVIDARPGSPLAKPAPLLRAVVERCSPDRRTLLLFDPLDAMVERWGLEMARLFFTRTCPILLELGAIAYWSLTGDRGEILSRDVEATTQCVIAVEDGRLRIVKAEGRRPGTEGTVFRYRLEEGRPIVEPAPAAARLGAALRALRLHRGLSKTDLARIAGVSPSAISQAERGLRGLSLDTLLRLSTELHVTLDELLGGKLSASYRLGRRHDPAQRAAGRPVPLLDDPEVGLRAYLLHLPPPRLRLARDRPQGPRAGGGRKRARPSRSRGGAPRSTTRRGCARREERRDELPESRRSGSPPLLDSARRHDAGRRRHDALALLQVRSPQPPTRRRVIWIFRQTFERGVAMTRVLCAVDDSPAGREAADAAIAFCRQHGAELRLVGIVKPSAFDPPQPSYGERVRRYNRVQAALARAASQAREAGLRPEVTVRWGVPASELLDEAQAAQADEVFVGRWRSPIRAVLTRRPRVTVTRVAVAGSPRAKVERELAEAA